MKRLLPLLLAALLALRADADTTDTSARARAILDGVIGALPDIPLLVNAEMQARASDGDVERRMNVEMLLDWQDVPPQARYTLRDAFGAPVSHLGITWPPEAPPEYRYLTGNPLQAAPVPDLASPIGETDLTWLDLSLAFLRWPDARVAGEADVKGRRCAVIDINAPPGSPPGLSGVRVWIDPRIGMLLRAESYNDDSERLRRMDIKSFRKINDRWFIKDIEVRSFPSKHRTLLRVIDVQDRERKRYLDRDDGGPDPGTDEDLPPAEAIPDAPPIAEEPVVDAPPPDGTFSPN